MANIDEQRKNTLTAIDELRQKIREYIADDIIDVPGAQDIEVAFIEYLDDIRSVIENTDDAEELNSHLRTIQYLNLTASGFNLLKWGLNLVNAVGKLVINKELFDEDFLKKTGQDVLRTAIAFKELIMSSELSTSSKLGTLMLAFAKAAISTIKGALTGLKEGFKEGRGLVDTLATMFSGTVTGASSGFFSKLYETFENKLIESGNSNLIDNATHEEEGITLEEDNTPLDSPSPNHDYTTPYKKFLQQVRSSEENKQRLSSEDENDFDLGETIKP